MFLVESEGEQMGLKAMNCPGHMLMFASEVRSYKDLPIRYHEQTPLHRNEASGVLSGLTRVRQFAQDDGHCFVTPEQIGSEVEHVLRLVQRVYRDFGLKPEMKLSTRPEEFLGEIAAWDEAEAGLKRALDAIGEPYTINAGDGAFYGPKIDFDVTDAIGRKWQCATIQLDYQLPERFDLHYVGADNAAPPAGGDPPRHFRQLRAVPGASDRALRRGLAAVAGPGPGGGAAAVGSARRISPPRSGRRWPRPASGSNSTRAWRRLAIKFGRHRCRRSPTCWSSATGR